MLNEDQLTALRKLKTSVEEEDVLLATIATLRPKTDPESISLRESYQVRYDLFVKLARPFTMHELATDAMSVQDACNLGGVAGGMHRAVTVLGRRLELEGLPCGTDAKNKHPISQMWASKIVSLAGMDYDSGGEKFQAAYDAVEALIIT